MAQPTWITPAGSLGIIPENKYFQYDMLAETPIVATPTVTSSSTTRFTCSSLAGVYPGLNVMFTGTVFGGVSTTIRYFVFAVYGNNQFSISQTEFSTTPITLTPGSGSMTAEFTQHVYFSLIAGSVPPGIQVADNGSIIGVPKAVASVQGVPQEVAKDVLSKFAVRAYTKKIVGSTLVLDGLADRTFTLTVTGQNIPEFITPSGNVGTYYDGTEVAIQLLFTDSDPGDNVVVRLASGSFPPGVAVTNRGLITGIIQPLVGPPGSAPPGYDSTPKDQYPNDFTTRSASRNFQFTLEITDGKDSNLRTFEIFVYSKDSMSADTTDFTADNTWITADVVPTRTPVLLTPSGSLGRVRSDNYYYFQFQAIDFDGDAVAYEISSGLSSSPPRDLVFDSDTGWLYGHLVSQGPSEIAYEFTVVVYKRDYPTIRSEPSTFTMTVIGNIETEVIWLTDSDLGSIDNGGISVLEVAAVNTGGRALQYRLVGGSNSKLPQGLTLQPTGHITGRVSFNTFALDGGTTTFDTLRRTRLDPNPTTFDMTFEFDVNAFAPQAAQLGYKVSQLVIINGGSSYDPLDPPTVVIAPPPSSAVSVQATAGIPTIVDGAITSITVVEPGSGYSSTPVVTIIGGSGGGAVVNSLIEISTQINSVDVVRRFSITVNRVFNTPYESLYIKCMPPNNDRALISQLLQDPNIFPNDLLYRADDSNFGLASNVVYVHALGLNPATLDTYVESLAINHYWRNITLGEIRTAQALDSSGNVLYEVVYSAIIDDLLNNSGVSVGKSVELPYPVVLDDGTVTVVYPNSLPNMRNQVIDTVGQISPALPLWMNSKQANGNYLGFTPAWVIAYVNPGESGRIAYNISQQYGNQLNKIDFKVDRYELDRSQTHNWDPATDSWIPSPAQDVTFDVFADYLYDTPSLDTTGRISNTTTYTGDGNTVYFAVSLLPTTGKLVVKVGSVIQEYSTDYTVNFGYYPKFVKFETAPTNGSTVTIYQISDIFVTNRDGALGTQTVFDGGSMTFSSPADRWTETDDFDKYLVFPKQTILG